MKYLILGAGPAGLTFANKLSQAGISDFLVLEKENTGGGLCRSNIVDGSPFDIGGGHFLDVRHSWVNEFLFSFMPENEWHKYERNSSIAINNYMINYPIEANIWQMKIETQVEYLKSVAVAGCNIGSEMPKKFTDWIYWKLGYKIANEYMLPYNQKMFGSELNQLGTYWLEKLPDVSFDEILLSCLKRKAYGTQPAHVSFYYPKKYGYGELWLRMADAIKNNIEYGKTVKKIDFKTKTVTTMDGAKYSANMIITTIPWLEFDEIDGMPDSIRKSIRELKYSSIQTKYYKENMQTSSHWIYYPDLELSYHRILVRSNFCSNSRGYWTETNSDRISMEQPDDNFKYVNKYAYPLNTINKPEIMRKLLSWSKAHNVIGLGRWGEHEHYNSDVTVDLAMKLFKQLENCE